MQVSMDYVTETELASRREKSGLRIPAARPGTSGHIASKSSEDRIL